MEGWREGGGAKGRDAAVEQGLPTPRRGRGPAPRVPRVPDRVRSRPRRARHRGIRPRATTRVTLGVGEGRGAGLDLSLGSGQGREAGGPRDAAVATAAEGRLTARDVGWPRRPPLQALPRTRLGPAGE